MELDCVAEADLNRSLSAKPANRTTTARATHTTGLRRRLKVGATFSEGSLGCGVASDEATADIIDSEDSSPAGTTPSWSTTEALSGPATNTRAKNLYPRRGTVSTKRGLSAESF